MASLHGKSNPQRGPLLAGEVARQGATLHASGGQGTVGRSRRHAPTPRNDARQRSATSGEDGTDEGAVRPPLPHRHQRFIAALDAQDPAVDAGSWPEVPCVDASVETKDEPRCGLGGHQGAAADASPLASHLPLRQQHRLSPAAGRQQATQDRRGQVEGNVADHGRPVQGDGSSHRRGRSGRPGPARAGEPLGCRPVPRPSGFGCPVSLMMANVHCILAVMTVTSLLRRLFRHGHFRMRASEVWTNPPRSRRV